MLLLIVWAGLMILAFAMIYHALGPRFQAASGPIGFGTLFYMSASTFLTLGLGDVTSADPIGRLFIILESGTGYLFLGLIITYMPVLDQAYDVREVGNLLIHSRAGRPPGAIKLLHRYSSPDRLEILRGILREGERWMAEILQSHLSHPVLSFYRAQHWGHSWLVSLTITLDSCALLIVGGDGMAAEQAKLTYRMGLQLLRDLTDALGLAADLEARGRLTEAEVPAFVAALEASAIPWTIGPRETVQLIRLVRRYEVYLLPLAEWLVIPLPDWVPAADGEAESRRTTRTRRNSGGIPVIATADAHRPGLAPGRSRRHRRQHVPDRGDPPAVGPALQDDRRPHLAIAAAGQARLGIAAVGNRDVTREQPDRLDRDISPAAGPSATIRACPGPARRALAATSHPRRAGRHRP